ncbi:phospholipid carrier-dependent glycosyltransferase [Candidatus Daviesbacteria bacterium]|nr:phospholipid carrier-dependent glycosyltransferase [Candidatus Daviesbacteria bacterium]
MKLTKSELLLVVLIFLLTLFLRTYKIEDYLFFGYEQGRDAIIVENIISLKDFTLVGPSTSIGGIFHGPYYYYLLAIPYFLGKGDPLSASFFLILLGSISSILIYIFSKQFFRSKIYALLTSLLFVFSFEYISYSRWLSNVSPSVLFIILSFLFLYKYSNSLKQINFILFILFSSLASQFEMIIFPIIVFIVIAMLLFKVIKIPSLKALHISLLVFIIVFFPLILFDFRNQHISINSLTDFILNPKIDENAKTFNPIASFIFQSKLHLQRSLINIENDLIIAISLLLTLVGFILFFTKNRSFGKFILIWAISGLPLIFIGPGNPQNYVPVGIGWIFLIVASVKGWIENSRFKIIGFILIFTIIFSFKNTINNLIQNKNFFFVTIQEDLNLADQRKVLHFLNSDSNGEPYKFLAFTIPSLHPEGWEYLHKYYYPNEAKKKGKFTYIVIEKNVYPIWENKWIADLGKTKLIEEKYFGLLRVQKRIAD